MVKYYIVSMRYVNSIVAMCHCSARSQFNYYIVSMRYVSPMVALYHCIIVRIVSLFGGMQFNYHIVSMRYINTIVTL